MNSNIMYTMNRIEIIGFMASLFVFFSFIPKDVKKIRIINTLGCIIWVVYGFLSHATSVWFMNGLLMFVHLYHFVKDGKLKDSNINNKE